MSLGVVAVAFAALMASRWAWVCDDAFISFRYAWNLVHHLGLVFNPGEHVEGYTNFLWTLWISLGLRLGADAEGWSVAWGVVCYGAAVALLAYRARRRSMDSGVGFALPIAALLAATHLDWQRYATSGLETSLFTALLVLAYVLLLAPRASVSSASAAGISLALAALTRPEGMLFALLGGAFLVATRRGGWRVWVVFAASFLVLWGPFTAWRLWYYGDFFPNTFYAKSGDRAWWGQGWTYARLYLQKYWIAGAALPAAALSLWLTRPGGPGPASPAHRARFEEAALAAAFALGLSLYVVRVGGDFMYARMLIPATPFLFVLLEIALEPLLNRRPLAGSLTAAVAVAALWLTPEPLPDARIQSGITNEWAFYPRRITDALRLRAVTLRPFFAGLPVCVAFLGSEARTVYYARPAEAVECEGGLTDRWLARQPLAVRGRVGHEKHAPPAYLITRRGADVIFHPRAVEVLGLAGQIPLGVVRFGEYSGLLLHWNPALMAAWRQRGAEFVDFPNWLDQLLPRLPGQSDAEVRQEFGMFKRFYFDFVQDPARETPFLARLAASGVAPGASRGDGSPGSRGPVDAGTQGR